MYVKFWKRFFDIVLSVIGLIVAAIPMAIVAIAIKWDSPGPVILNSKDWEDMEKCIPCTNSVPCV